MYILLSLRCVVRARIRDDGSKKTGVRMQRAVWGAELQQLLLDLVRGVVLSAVGCMDPSPAVQRRQYLNTPLTVLQQCLPCRFFRPSFGKDTKGFLLTESTASRHVPTMQCFQRGTARHFRSIDGGRKDERAPAPSSRNADGTV